MLVSYDIYPPRICSGPDNSQTNYGYLSTRNRKARPEISTVDRYPNPDPTKFETNKYMERNLDPNTIRIRIQI